MDINDSVAFHQNLFSIHVSDVAETLESFINTPCNLKARYSVLFISPDSHLPDPVELLIYTVGVSFRIIHYRICYLMLL